MKRFAIAVLLGLAVPMAAHAQDAGSNSAPGAAANCPGMNFSGMQNQLGGMMGDVSGMMQAAKDPALKEQLSKMHDRMALMMTNMQKNRGGMGGMMGGGMMQNAPKDDQSGGAKPGTKP